MVSDPVVADLGGSLFILLERIWCSRGKFVHVMIPHMDRSYVFSFTSCFIIFLPALPAIPMHDPRGQHVI